MSLLDDIRAAQIKAAEDAVIQNLKRSGLVIEPLRLVEPPDEIATLRAKLAAAEARAERFIRERDQARATQDAAVRLLTGVHALLYPPRFTDHDGRTWQFKNPHDSDAVLQELSDRIRALPDQIAALNEG